MKKIYTVSNSVLIMLILFSGMTFAQELTREEKKEKRHARKQEKIESGKLMITPLAVQKKLSA